MNLKITLSLIFIFPFLMLRAKSQSNSFDRPAFYKVMSLENLNDMEAELNIIKAAAIPEKEAYEGALLMKKSGKATKAKDKLSLFKSGRSKLELAITKDKGNIEYRFLRVIIQENAPKVVKYRNNLDEDCTLIKANFNSLPQFLQQQIMEYSKKSAALKIT